MGCATLNDLNIGIFAFDVIEDFRNDACEDLAVVLVPEAVSEVQHHLGRCDDSCIWWAAEEHDEVLTVNHW